MSRYRVLLVAALAALILAACETTGGQLPSQQFLSQPRGAP